MTNFDRRTLLSGIGAACLAAAPAFVSPSRSAAQTVPAIPQLPVPRVTQSHDFISLSAVQTSSPQVALTFDDGPHPTNTPQLLDILAAYDVRATFFVVGQMAQRYPEILRRIVAEGHEIGNHSWSHPMLSRMSDVAVLREIDRTQEVVWRAVGAVPVSMRPPYGAITARQSRMIDERRNMPTIMWSVDPEDWRRPGPSVVASRIVRGARAGAVILAHDIHGPTIRAVPSAIEGISNQGLRFATMSQITGCRPWGPRGLRVVGRRERRDNWG